MKYFMIYFLKKIRKNATIIVTVNNHYEKYLIISVTKIYIFPVVTKFINVRYYHSIKNIFINGAENRNLVKWMWFEMWCVTNKYLLYYSMSFDNNGSLYSLLISHPDFQTLLYLSQRSSSLALLLYFINFFICSFLFSDIL